MKKENEINNSKTSPTVIDSTDLGTFLGKISRCLTKEGNSLQSLAGKWFDAGENRNIARQFGIDIVILGDKLLAIRNQICQDCQLKPVNIFIDFKSHNEKIDSE